MKTLDKKILILDIAEELFCINGSKETTIRLITKKANINIAMLHYYFKSKENLFGLLFERRINHFRKSINGLDLTNKSVFEAISLYSCFYIDLIFKFLPFYKLMMRERLSNTNEHMLILLTYIFDLMSKL